MGTKIEWCDEVWNPVTGCTPVSPACDNCYARRMANRLRGRFGYYPNDPFRVTQHLNRINQPFSWKKPRRVFVCSMGDLFHEDVQSGIVIKILSIIDALPQHNFLLLTKRPHIMQYYLDHMSGLPGYREDWPMKNLWIGVTAENQSMADYRIPILFEIPAAVRFVSVEPMLEAVDLKKWMHERHSVWDNVEKRYHHDYKDRINWIIAGAETGPGARAMHPGHVIKLYDHCQAAGVPFFFKKESKGWPVPDYIKNTREFPGDKSV